MKTYILDSLNKYKRFSESLDVQTLLCNKSWYIFNNEGEKELYIFKSNGELIITCNGVGTKGQWEWITANKTILISSKEQVVMLHPEYVDEVVLALSVDGTSRCVFMIDEKDKTKFVQNTLSELESYFIAKESKKQIEQKEKEAKEKNKLEQERFRRLKEENQKREIERQAKLKSEAESLYKSLRIDNIGFKLVWWVLLLIVPYSPVLLYNIIPENLLAHNFLNFILLVLAGFIILLLIYWGVSVENKKRLKRWMRQNSNDMRITYLKEYL